MSVEQLVIEKLQLLPPEKQREVLDFVESLEQQSLEKPSFQNVRGLWANLAVEITEGDLTEVHQEMWSDFPRGDI